MKRSTEVSPVWLRVGRLDAVTSGEDDLLNWINEQGSQAEWQDISGEGMLIMCPSNIAVETFDLLLSPTGPKFRPRVNAGTDDKNTKSILDIKYEEEMEQIKA